MRYVIIGLGGIGKSLVEPLCRLIAYSPETEKQVILVDGDAYEEKNRERQSFRMTANKAEETARWLKAILPELTVEAKPRFVDEDNIFLFVRESDTIFLACDNHPTRKVVSDHVGTLANALLISGGNDETDGNIQIYERKDGRDLTPPLTWQHPEIEFPNGVNPAKVGCGQAIEAGATQLLTVNFMIAAMMLSAYTLRRLKGRLHYQEVYFDLITGNVRPVNLEKGVLKGGSV